MYDLTLSSDCTAEIADACKVLDWLPGNLSGAISAKSPASPDFSQMVIAGHSRGGKVAFGVALGVSPSSLQYSALVAIDPVDGTTDGTQTKPPILTYKEHSFNLPFPTLVIGSGLGSQKKGLVIPPCAPAKVGHRVFFNDSGAPAYHFVPTAYGHMDFLDDQTDGVLGAATYVICKNGPDRQPERTFAGGAIVAFLNATLRSNFDDLDDLLQNPSHANTAIEKPEWYELPEDVRRDASKAVSPELVLAV